MLRAPARPARGAAAAVQIGAAEDLGEGAREYLSARTPGGYSSGARRGANKRATVAEYRYPAHASLRPAVGVFVHTLLLVLLAVLLEVRCVRPCCCNTRTMRWVVTNGALSLRHHHLPAPAASTTAQRNACSRLLFAPATALACMLVRCTSCPSRVLPSFSPSHAARRPPPSDTHT